MKNVKFLKSLIALSCVFTLGLGIVAGCNNTPACEHVYTWTVNKESTCTEKGMQTGVCGICNDIKTEELPLDETKHVYTGDWVITKPTEEADGLAVKTCANNSEHTTQVVLPKLTITGKGYDSKEFITVPTTAREGEMKLTLKNTYGDITFNAPLAKRKLNNMDDAVILASSLQENVGLVTGYFKQAEDGIENKFSYYFGEDFTRVDDISEGKTYFYSIDEDGKVFAMSDKYVEPARGETYYTNSYYFGANGGKNGIVVSDIDEGCINGFHYNSSVNISTFYGAEQGLARLYETAMNGLESGSTVNYQSIKEVKPGDDGSLSDIWFSYSYDSGDWFTRFNVKFSTYNDGTLSEMTVVTEVIRPFMYVTDEAGSAVYYKEDDESVKNGNAVVGDIIFGFIYPDAEGGGNDYETYTEADGKVKYVYEQKDASGRLIYEKHTDSGLEYYAVTYANENSDNPTITYDKLDGKPEGLEYVYVTDAYGMTVCDAKGEPIKKIMAKNCYPVVNRYSDNHEQVSYKTAYFKQDLKTSADYKACENKYSSASRYIQDFEITAARAGNSSINISNGLILPTNKVITLVLGKFSPATANLKSDTIDNIYIVDDTGNRIKLLMDYVNGSKYRILGSYASSSGTITLNSQYAGDVKFIITTQGGKCEKEINVTFTKSAPSEGMLIAIANVYSVVDGLEQYKDLVVTTDNPVKVNVGQTVKFKAQATGNEAAYVSTDTYPTSSEGITFSQPETGNFTDWQFVATKPGEYTVKMPYYNGTTSSATVYAEFKVIVSAKPDPVQMLSGNTFSGNVLIGKTSGNPESRVMRATFSAAGEISINITGVTDEPIVYTYSVDGTTGELVTAYKSGLSEKDNKSYNFSFSINEAGDLVVSHSTGMGNIVENKVLSKVTE